MGIDQSFHFIEGRLFVLRLDRHMEVGNAVPLDHTAQIVMIGNHAGDIAVQFIAVPAVQQVSQAMRLATGHQHHAFFLRRISNPPLHGKLAGDGRKGLMKPC
ncbi:hypothetical protein D3C71_1693630 [compost metagenome]